MQKIWEKKPLMFLGIIVLFLGLSYGFVPQVLDGKIVNQSDISGYVGMAHEANQWNDEHPDDRTAWTDSMFGGMPTTMLTGNPEGDWTQSIYNAFLTGKRPCYLPVYHVVRRVSPDAQPRNQSHRRHRRSCRCRLLFLQHANHPGRPQHQNDGHRLAPVGPRRRDFHLPDRPQHV